MTKSQGGADLGHVDKHERPLTGHILPPVYLYICARHGGLLPCYNMVTTMTIMT